MGNFECERTRCFFSLFGEGETGSPRSRFRARDTADVGATGNNGASGGLGLEGSPGDVDSARFGADLVGVEKGLRVTFDGKGVRLALFLAGEKGLKVARGAVVSATLEVEGSNCDAFGGVEGPGAAAAASLERRL